MDQRLVQRLIAVVQIRIFTDHSDIYILLRLFDTVNDVFPNTQIRFFLVWQAEAVQHLIIKTFRVVAQRHFVDCRHVERRNNLVLVDVTKQCNLAQLVFFDLAIRTAQQNTRTNTYAHQFFYRVLCRFSFQLARSRNIRQQCHMNKQGALTTHFVTELADRFQKWQGFNITNRTADFTQNEVSRSVFFTDKVFDFVSNVRNDLHSCAEVITAALTRQHVRVDTACRDVVHLFGRIASETFVVPQIQICFCTVVSYIDFAMLERAHSTGVNVQVRVKLTQANGVTTSL